MPADLVASIGLPLLTAGEERDLARRRDAGDASAREALILANVRLASRVTRVVARARRRDPEDYLSAGHVGLCVAADKYDPARDCRFSTVAAWWIRSHVARAIANEASTVRTPIYMVTAVGALAAGRPIPKGFKKESLDALPAARAAMASRASGTARRDGESPDVDEAWPSAAGRWDDDRGGPLWRLRAALDALDGPDRALAAIRWGLGGDPPLSRQETARRLGRTAGRVESAERRILAHLKRAVGPETEEIE